MQDNRDWQPGGGRSGRIVAAVVIALVVVFVLLHLSGVFGP